MDIAVIIPQLEFIGGAEKFSIECMKRWQKKHDITLYSTSFNENFLKDFGLDINFIKLKRFFRPLKRYKDLGISLEMRRMANQIDKHEIYNLHLFPANLIEKHPSIWFPHEPPRMLYDLNSFFFGSNYVKLHKKIIGRFYFPILRYINEKYTLVDEIVANSFYSKLYLEEVYKRKINNIIYPGVDWKAFKYKKGYPNVILTVNRLHPEKRVDLIIKSMPYLADYKLWIVGNGIHKQNLEMLTKNLNLEDRVKFFGVVKETKLKELYSQCFCTVYTPLREPFGMVALESMAAGKPIIGCNEGGFTEIVENKRNGFLIDPTPEKIAEKVIYLSKNLDIYKDISENCRNKSKKYSWDNTAKKLLRLFKVTTKNE
jgi:glycosyltransferase involved in cell wall biosynthesis